MLIKLGGSVVTVKNERLKPNIENIKRLVAEIAEILPQKIILIHGGGSYGHPLAIDYKINEGYSFPNQLIGFSKTHQAMLDLNKIIINEFLDANVPAFGLSPSSFILTENNKIKQIDTQIIKNLLKMDMIPVLYGDAILDTEKGFSILSGDRLIVELAIKIRAKKLIFGCDVDGIFTSNPNFDLQAKLINEVTVKNLDELSKIGGSINMDVTGGMYGKIMEARKAVKAGVQVVLVNAMKPKRIQKSILGKKVKGTYIIY
jgi:isopentenyl phosphate kinase